MGSWVHGLMGSLVHDMDSWVHGSWVHRLMGSLAPAQKHSKVGSWPRANQKLNDDEPTMNTRIVSDRGWDLLMTWVHGFIG